MYKYTDKNLLDNPESYFYSKFDGKLFLESFFIKRNEKLLEFRDLVGYDYNLEDLKTEIISKIKLS